MIAPWLLYATLLALCLGVVAVGIQRIAQMRRAQFRWIWCGAMIASVVLPVMADVMASPVAREVDIRQTSSAISASISFDTLLLSFWAIASLIMLSRLVTSMLVLRRSREAWQEQMIDGNSVLLSADVGPAVVGLAHPRAVIPAWALELNPDERALILRHEAEHAGAGDPRLMALAAASVVAMPWNPALWWLVRRLRLAIEMDCDTRVLRSGADPRRYASLLLTIGERISESRFAWVTALAEPRSLLERRIAAMISPRFSRRPWLVISGFGAVAAVALVIACETPVPSQVLPGNSAEAKPQEMRMASVVAHDDTVSSVESELSSIAVDAPLMKAGDTVFATVLDNGRPKTVRMVYRNATEELPSKREGGEVRESEQPSKEMTKESRYSGNIYFPDSVKSVDGTVRAGDVTKRRP